MKAIAILVLAACLWMSAIETPYADDGPGSDIDRQTAQAAALFEQGRNAEARKIYEALLPSLRDRPSPQLGFVLNGLSKVAGAAGDYDGALQFARQSADIYRQIGDARGESHSLNNQGIALIQTGRYPEARQTFEQAFILSQHGRDPENQVQVLNNLGSSFYYPGSYSEALHRYDEAMALVGQNRDATWSDYWSQITSFNQATLFQRLGRYEKALQIYRQVEQSSKSLTPGDRAHLYANLGALYRRLGDPYKALDTYRSAQTLYAQQHDAGGELTVIKNIGIAYALDLEDLRRAEEIFGSAISLAQKTNNRREEMQAHLYLGETFFRARNPSAKAEFERCLTLANELGTNEEQWKSLYGIGKIKEMSGDSASAEQDYRQAIGIIEKTRSQLQLGALRSEFFADKREAYDALISLLLKRNEVAESFLFLERSRARNFQDRLHVLAGGQQEVALTMDQAQRTLPAETALLEFWTSGDRVGLIWCKRDGAGLVLKELSPKQAAQIRDFLAATPGTLSGNWRERAQVFEAFFSGNMDFLTGIRHLLIVPDGWISYVPFDLLNAGNGSVLIERYDITYSPTAALLRRPRGPEKRFWFPWSYQLAAFGDPSVDTQKPAANPEELEHGGAQRLPFSEQEIHSIANLVRGQRKMFLGDNDRKKLFLSSKVNNALLLHVSTHAFVDADSPENSRLLFSPDSPDAGADYVFLRELYDLNLSQVRLATISACDTERGKIVRGEGVQAFSRALLSAGAASSLTTLWRVDDEATAEFMRQFYYLVLHERLPKAEALRLAKLKFLRSNSGLADPRHWAAFVLNGDGSAPLPYVFSWTELVAIFLFLLAAVAAPAFWLHLRRRRRSYREQRARTVVA